MNRLVELRLQRWLSVLALFSCVTAPAATLYVWQESPNPAPPYTNWAAAATNIQDAVDAAQVGDTVLVTNGLYATGGRTAFGLLTNRVVIDKPILVQSVNGPAVTVIEGAPTPGGGNGNEAIRCAYVGTNAVLSGFTLTNGHTRSRSPASFGVDPFGGGCLCEKSGSVSNCVLTSNSAGVFGGGVYGGTLWHSTLSGNSASWAGGGAAEATLQQCTVSRNLARDNSNYGGGGAFRATLYRCILNENAATSGGGALDCALESCILANNGATDYPSAGGGVLGSTLYNCVVIGNAAGFGGGAYGSSLYNCTVSSNHGAGVRWSTIYNCIIYFNRTLNHQDTTVYHSCTTPLPAAGLGNSTNEPAFVDPAAGDFRLRFGSPCIDAGTNLSSILTNDLDGNLRPLDGNGDGVAAFDMGAYEFDLRTLVPTSWFLRYGLDPADPHVVSGDPDRDALTTFQEWVADTDPTNAASCLRITAASNRPPATLFFASSSNRLYTLFASTNLAGSGSNLSAWSSVPGQADIPGTGGRQVLQDTNAPSTRFYRVGARVP